MSATADNLRSQVLALPPNERAELAVDLLDSLDARPVDSDPADAAELDRVWADETARRAAQIDSGVVTTDSWDDLLDKVARSRRPR